MKLRGVMIRYYDSSAANRFNRRERLPFKEPIRYEPQRTEFIKPTPKTYALVTPYDAHFTRLRTEEHPTVGDFSLGLFLIGYLLAKK